MGQLGPEGRTTYNARFLKSYGYLLIYRASALGRAARYEPGQTSPPDPIYSFPSDLFKNPIFKK